MCVPPHWGASGRAYFIRLAKIEISCRLKHRQASWDNNESGIMGSHPALGFPQQTTNQTNTHKSAFSIHFHLHFQSTEDLCWIFVKFSANEIGSFPLTHNYVMRCLPTRRHIVLTLYFKLVLHFALNIVLHVYVIHNSQFVFHTRVIICTSVL